MNIITPEIYDGFQPLEAKLTGWHGTAAVFASLISDLKPQHIIEIGSWRGQSAITMGKAVKRACLPTRITCVDTWLGSLEFWTHWKHTPERDLMLKHGYPQVYYQFLSNVVNAGLEDVILPFPTTSLIAARYFKKIGIKAQMIYVDGSHEYEDVIQDCVEYWGILEAGGVLFGDDFDWNGVQKAIRKFSSEARLLIKHAEPSFWILRKPTLERRASTVPCDA